MPGYKRWRPDRNAWELVVPRTRDPLSGARRTASRLYRGGEREADRALARFTVEVMDERVTVDATVEQLLARWLDTVAADLSPTTVRSYRQNIRLHIVPAIGGVKIADLGPEALDALYRAKVAGGLSPASVQRLHAVIRRSLSQAVKWGWIDTNPAARATPPRARQYRPTLPPMDDVLALIDRAMTADPELGLLVRLAVITGMRRGELVGLRWPSVNLEQRSILVDSAVIDVGGRLEVKEPKWHSNRRVAIDGSTADLLAEHYERVVARAASCGESLRPEAFVWSLDVDGARPIRPEAVTSRWRSLCRSQKVRCRFHDLRHISASQLIAAGVDVRTVAGRLGHATASTTLGIYAHAFAARDQVAAGVLGDLLGA